MAKMNLKVTVNDLHFQYQPQVSHDACFVQIWWFKLKSVTSYRANKEKFSDGRTTRQTDRDGQTQATTIPFLPERPKGNKGKCLELSYINSTRLSYDGLW